MLSGSMSGSGSATGSTAASSSPSSIPTSASCRVDIPTAVYLVDSNGNRTLLSSAVASPDGEGRLRRRGGGGIGCDDGGGGADRCGRDGTGGPLQQQQDQEQQCVEIVLDEQEHQLVQVLVGTVDAYERGLLQGVADMNSNSNNQQPQQVTVRVAGGWVRDKILGKESHDVDVAIDCLTGVQFAQLVQHYVLQVLPNGQAHKGQQEGRQEGPTTAATSGMLSASRRIGVIAARPEQSKHLETATMKLCGLDVDFLNLRGQEQYGTQSRIPITSFGTPMEDAMRRDFTMNSLFYNLRTRRVEDFLQRGWDDLKRGILVTPLDALSTFRDDPLRVLRAIRFAVRYQFGLDNNLREAAVHPEIHKALHVKISRERVGKELEGMLSGKMANPVQALQVLSDLQLAGSVFCLPLPGVNSVGSVSGTVCGHPFNYDTWDDADSEVARNVRKIGWQEARKCLDVLPRVIDPFVQEEEAPSKRTAEGERSVIDRRLLPVAAFLLPFRTLSYRHATKQPLKDVNAVAHIMREGLKFKNADCNAMTLLMESVDNMASFLRRRKERPNNQQEIDVPSFRLEVGMMLRNLKDAWVTCLLLATVVLQRESQRAQERDDASTSCMDEGEDDWVSTARDVYRDVATHKLDRTWLIRPLLDGASIATVLQIPKGPLVARYLKEQVHWMLLRPDGTREACVAHLTLLHQQRQEEARGNAAPQVRHVNDEDNEQHLGASDGTGKTPSSPVLGSRQPSERHFSKKIHVESMDLS